MNKWFFKADCAFCIFSFSKNLFVDNIYHWFTVSTRFIAQLLWGLSKKSQKGPACPVELTSCLVGRTSILPREITSWGGKNSICGPINTWVEVWSVKVVWYWPCLFLESRERRNPWWNLGQGFLEKLEHELHSEEGGGVLKNCVRNRNVILSKECMSQGALAPFHERWE